MLEKPGSAFARVGFGLVRQRLRGSLCSVLVSDYCRGGRRSRGVPFRIFLSLKIVLLAGAILSVIKLKAKRVEIQSGS